MVQYSTMYRKKIYKRMVRNELSRERESIFVSLQYIKDGRAPTYGGQNRHGWFVKYKRLLIVRSVVHKSMHAYILHQAADSNCLRIFWYMLTCGRFTLINVIKLCTNCKYGSCTIFLYTFYFFYSFYFFDATVYQNSCLQKIPHFLF